MPTNTEPVRPGEPADAAALACCHHRCWLHAFADLVTPPEAVDQMDPDRNLERFSDWLSPMSDPEVTVVERDGQVVGYSTVVGNELVHLFVDPDQAGRGYGRRLLAAAEEHMVDAGYRMLELHTMVGNDPAIGLYESAGWQMTDQLVHTDNDNGVSYDEHVLVKHLT